MKTTLKYTDPNTGRKLTRTFYSRRDAETNAARLILAGIAVTIKPRMGLFVKGKP